MSNELQAKITELEEEISKLKREIEELTSQNQAWLQQIRDVVMSDKPLNSKDITNSAT